VSTAPASHFVPLYGIPVIVDRNIGPRVQHRKPRTKNRRIRAKWAKNPRNWRGGLTGAADRGFMMFGTYYVSPEGYRMLVKACAQEASKAVTNRPIRPQRRSR
jgi:hypothetical protein